MKKPRTLLNLLNWAWREELPKISTQRQDFARAFGPRYAGGGLVSLMELSSRVDYNQYGAVCDPTAADDPHMDALRLGDAVLALDDLVVDLGDDYSPLADMPSLADMGQSILHDSLEAIKERRNDILIHTHYGQNLKGSDVCLSSLVALAAIRGRVEGWQMPEPEAKVVRFANGKECWFVKKAVMIDGFEYIHEVNAYDKRTKMLEKGAYRKYTYEPSLQDCVMERFNYSLIQIGLSYIHDTLAKKLDDYKLIDEGFNHEPWKGAAHGA
jgi:hypothetical protein